MSKLKQLWSITTWETVQKIIRLKRLGFSKKRRKFKVDFQRENGSKNYLTKKASQPIGNFVIFSKKCNRKTMISAAKT